MRIAIIGTGIAGMVAAYLLSDEHELVVYEAEDYVGGHTNTVDVSLNGNSYAVDTGFIVFNEKTYPNFVQT
jgi:predicted NAD/FAD-binding protein